MSVLITGTTAGDGSEQGKCPTSSLKCFGDGKCAICKVLGTLSPDVTNGCDPAESVVNFRQASAIEFQVCSGGTSCQACSK